jgi:lipid-binding SYLF domain-containing protein
MLMDDNAVGAVDRADHFRRNHPAAAIHGGPAAPDRGYRTVFAPGAIEQGASRTSEPTHAAPTRRAFLSRLCVVAGGLSAAALTTHGLPAHAAIGGNEAEKAQNVINGAENALAQMLAKPEGGPIRALLGQASGVLILPSLLKGAFIFGGQGGSGVMLVKNSDGTWSAPAFYTAAGASWGLQVGIQDTAVLMIMMNPGVVEKTLAGGLQLGAGASLAAGPVGGGSVDVNTTNVRKDIYYYNFTNQGLFAGISLEGAGLAPRDDLNHAYYKDPSITPREIVSGKYNAPGAQNLRASLASASGGGAHAVQPQPGKQ